MPIDSTLDRPTSRKLDADDRRMVSLLAWLTIGGVVVYVVLDVVAQLLPPHYSPIHQAESDLAVGPYGWVMTINFVVRGLLSVALGIALAQVLTPSRRTTIGLALLAVWSAGAFVLAASPTDIGRTHTLHGQVHLIVALLAFICIPIAERLLSDALAADPQWMALGRHMIPLANLTIGTFVLLLVGTAAPRLSGITERLFLAAALLWILVAALALRNPGQRTGAMRAEAGT